MSEEKPPSERRLMAHAIARFCLENGLAINRGSTDGVIEADRHYVVPFTKEEGVEGVVRIYGMNFIQVRFTYGQLKRSYIFEAEEFVKDFLRLFFVIGDWEAAGRVPVKSKEDPHANQG